MAKLLRGSILLFFLLSSYSLFSQTTFVEGIVRDESTGDPIAFAHIFFKGTQIGITSDTTGHFRLQTSKKVDSLVISYLGYVTERIAIKLYERQKVEIKLRSQFMQLQEIEVRAGENPAWVILEKVVDAKKVNNPAKATKTVTDCH
ncbi:MAG: carboxypeptidase-like regulatory domain-containing protein, partial [Chryseolinea sp.]